MEHTTVVFFHWLKNNPETAKYFKGTTVLDVGSYDLNGSLKEFFEDCNYIGLDVMAGNNVDVVCLAKDYDAPDGSYDLIVSAGTWEHDMQYKDSLKNITRLLKPGGLLAFTCATIGYEEHCNETPDQMWIPSNALFKGYYRNLSQYDLECALDKSLFYPYHFGRVKFTHAQTKVESYQNILTFWAIKSMFVSAVQFGHEEVTNSFRFY